MKVVAVNGSARKDGNTALLLRAVLAELEREGIDTELLQLSGKNIAPCKACFKCMDNKDQRCGVKSDDANAVIEKLAAADGMLLGSPVYFADLSGGLKCLIERAGMTAKANGDMFARKAGAAVVAVRRAGSVHAFDSINHFFLIGQMIVPGSSYWNMGFGRESGEVSKDEEGMLIMRNLGRNMAWLLQKING